MSGDRVLVQQSIPTVTLPDGTTGVGMSGEFTIDTRQYNEQVTPTITAGAYAIGDAVGGKLTWTDVVDEEGGGITIDSIVFTDKGNQAADLALVLFNQDFSPTVDNAPWDPSDADLLNIIGIITSGVWYQFADNAVSSRHGLGVNGVLVGTNLYGQLYASTVVTYASTSDLSVRLGVRQD